MRSRNFLPPSALRLQSFLLLLAGFALVLLAACKGKDDAPPQPPIVQYIPAPSASVTGKVSVQGQAESGGILVFAEGTSYLAVTGTDGGFELAGLREGGYTIRAMRSDLEPVEVGELVIGAEDLKLQQPFLDLGTVTMKSGGWVKAISANPLEIAGLGTIRGRVAAFGSNDSSGVLVELSGTVFRTVTDEAGTFILANVPAGSYKVRFRKAGYPLTERSVAVTAGGNITMDDVDLNPRDAASILGHTILGTLVMRDAQGRAATDFAGVSITLTGTTFSATPDGTGIFQFSDLPPDRYTVAASREGYTLDKPAEVDLTSLDIAEVTLTLSATAPEGAAVGSVIGQVILEDADASGNGGVSVALGGTSFQATTDEGGYFAIEGLQPGTYSLVASLTGYEPFTLSGVQISAEQQTVAPPITLKRQLVPPKVLAVRPVNGAQDVSIEEKTFVTFVFNVKMDKASLEEAFSITPAVQYSIGPAAEDRFVVVLAGYTREGTPMKYGTQYTLKISKKAKSAEGAAMREDFTSKFTTGQAKIVRTWPADGEKGAFVNNMYPIRIYFNAPIDTQHLAITADDISIRPSLMSKPDVYMTNDMKTGWGYLNIGALFEADTEYSITIRGRALTITGDRIANIPYRFSFKTAERWEGNNRFGNPNDRDRREEEKNRK